MRSTSGSSMASGWVWGSAVYRPSMSLSSTSRSAVDAAADDGGQGVVVADGSDLIGGHGVVLVDDGQGTQLQQAVQSVFHVLPPVGVLNVHTGQQDLGHRCGCKP